MSKPAAIECEFTFIDHIAQQIHEGSVDIQLTKEREEDAASEKEAMADTTKKKIAVLITDGAPNGCTWEQILQNAQNILQLALQIKKGLII